MIHGQKRTKTGFTLIELLIVSALLSVVALAVFGTFTSGVNLWERLTQETVLEDLTIFFDKIAYDIRNSFNVEPLTFAGGSRSLSFPTIITYTGKEGRTTCVGQVTYTYDTRQGIFFRDQATMSEVYEEEEGRRTKLVDNVATARFTYYCYDKDLEDYFWATTWGLEDEVFSKPEEGPQLLAVRIEIVVRDGASQQTFTRTVSIPAWHYSRKEEA
jgi:prepilin-type N-terminal cleavage/methylation domain-containing protein